MPKKFTELHFLLHMDPKEAGRRIRSAYKEAGGVMRAAWQMGISESQYRRYCRRLGIDFATPQSPAGKAKRATLKKAALRKKK